MKYIEIYIKSIKKRAQPIQAASPIILNYNLPGLKSFKQLKTEEILKYKKEYNIVLERYRNVVKQHKNAKGDKRKELKVSIVSRKDRLDSLLQKINAYTVSEKTNGFEVPNAK